MTDKPPKSNQARERAEAEAREMIEALDEWSRQLGKMLAADPADDRDREALDEWDDLDEWER